jgi:hypothetical protein
MAIPKLGIKSTKEYFFEVVEPNYAKFKLNPGVRTALNAAWPLWHIHEWHYWENNPHGNRQGRSNCGEALINKHMEFLLLRNIAEAAKHFNLTTKQPVKVSSVNKRRRRMGGVAGVHAAGVFAAGIGSPPHDYYEIETVNGINALGQIFQFAFQHWQTELS